MVGNDPVTDTGDLRDLGEGGIVNSLLAKQIQRNFQQLFLPHCLYESRFVPFSFSGFRAGGSSARNGQFLILAHEKSTGPVYVMPTRNQMTGTCLIIVRGHGQL
jgi:hypothetical protein